MRYILFIIVVFVFSHNTFAQTRHRTPINTGWKFCKDKYEEKKAVTVNLPHTWNINDVIDDTPDYYRGEGWYKKMIKLTADQLRNKLSLYFEGVNQETEVFINGWKAAHHIGGYTGFSVPVSPYAKLGANEITVKANNSFNENIPPLTADFTFYGGIYRDVFLVETNPVHFVERYGADAVLITTPSVNEHAASVQVKSILENETSRSQKLYVLTIINDKKGFKITSARSEIVLKPGAVDSVMQQLPTVIDPKLWSPDDPYLYSVQTIITDERGNMKDRILNPVGFRWFSFDADKGFFLNGKSLKLIGASRHQDREGLGNAVPDALAVKDMLLLKQMGANFLRIAHYPQDPVILKTCDSLGLLASVEIPLVNEITESDSFYNNSERMLYEMLHQNFNHPSLIMWCYMNEILLRPHHNNDKEKQKTYFNNIAALARRLENIVRATDPHRYTMMADHGSYAAYKNTGLLEIPMVVGWNLYQGWYGGKITDFPVFLDMFHKEYPHKPFIISEYGSDADPRIRSNDPVRFDKSVEYTTAFHQAYYKAINERSFVAGAAVWNLADFNSETRTESMPHINNKGLLQWNRTPKDGYYFYQGVLAKKPYIKILGDKKRFGIQDSTSDGSLQTVQIASNLSSVTISLNNVSKQVTVQDGVGEIRLPFKTGLNKIAAQSIDKITKDQLNVQFEQQPFFASDKLFKQANIILGTNRFFTDAKGNVWQPDVNYSAGHFGSIGGQRYKQENNSRLPYGTDKNIIGTYDDPIWQTQNVGIKQFKFDVLPGTYTITLYFAELSGGEISSLPYNLSDEKHNEKIKRRVFSVDMNGKNIIHNLNLAHTYGSARAVQKSFTVTTNNDKGILLDFIPTEGEPVLNAIQIKRIK